MCTVRIPGVEPGFQRGVMLPPLHSSLSACQACGRYHRAMAHACIVPSCPPSSSFFPPLLPFLFLVETTMGTNISHVPCQALPEDEAVFFERTPIDEIDTSPHLAFGETRVSSKIESMTRSGVIVRVRLLVLRVVFSFVCVFVS